MRIALVLALAACSPTPMQGRAARTSDPVAHARYTALAWVEDEYSHDYDGYNALRADLLGIDETALAAAISDAPANLAAWRRMVTAGLATDGQVHDAIAYIDRLLPTRDHWRYHTEPGENDSTHAMMVGIAVIVVVIVLYAMSGQSPPSFAGAHPSTSTTAAAAPRSSGSRGGGGSSGTAITYFPANTGAPPPPARPTQPPPNAPPNAPPKAPPNGSDASDDARSKQAPARTQDDERNDYLDCVGTNHNCFYGTSAACMPTPPTGPYSQGALPHGAETTLAMCQPEKVGWPTSKCRAEVLSQLPEEEVHRLSGMLSKLQTRLWALPDKQQKKCGPWPEFLNPATTDQLRFWCGNRREDCEAQLPLARRDLIAADSLENCVYYAEFEARRDKLARDRIDQCSEWSGYAPSPSEIERDMTDPPPPSPVRNGPPKWPPPRGDE